MANSQINRQRPNQKSLRRTIGLMGPEPAQWSGNAWVGGLIIYNKPKPAGLIMSRLKVGTEQSPLGAVASSVAQCFTTMPGALGR
jgi:hypothetical protein